MYGSPVDQSTSNGPLTMSQVPPLLSQTYGHILRTLQDETSCTIDYRTLNQIWNEKLCWCDHLLSMLSNKSYTMILLN